MFRCLSAFIFATFPIFAEARCAGEGFEAFLTADQIAQVDTAAAAVPYGTGILWQAERDDVTLTILGTMHLPDARHDAIVDRILPDLTTADLLLVEATLEDQTEMQVYMADNPDVMIISEGPTLADRLDPAVWQAVKTAAEARGVPGFMAAKMQPWFLLLTLSMPVCAMTELMAGALGLDGLLMQAAADAGVPVAPLEPWQDMFALLTSGTFDEQVDALRMGLLDPFLADALMISLLDGYFAEETARVWELSYLIQDFLPDMDAAVFDEQMALMQEDLVNARNRNWIPVIEAAAGKHNNIFVAFGAAHLMGEDGVLRLLERSGWTITAR